MLGRAEYLRDASGMIAVKPWFGWGLNSYVFAVPPFTQYGARFARVHYQDWIPPVHNIYYLWWAEIGIVGLSIHLIWLAGVIGIGIKTCESGNRDAVRRECGVSRGNAGVCRGQDSSAFHFDSTASSGSSGSLPA